MKQAVDQEQIQAQESTPGQLFRKYVDRAIVFGCVPALVLSVLLWVVATAFLAAGALPIILSMLITFLLGVIGIVCIVRYVDVAATFIKKAQASFGTTSAEWQIAASVGAGVLCVFLTGCIMGVLAMAGTLEETHYTLLFIEVLVLGYQTWRVYLKR